MRPAERLEAPPDLDRFVLADAPPGSYQWWYFDALSDDGRFGLVAIFFVGGVFSPLYADRLAAGIPASPLDHPMVNLALYDHAKRVAWVFSEHPRERLEVSGSGLDITIGASTLKQRPDGAYEWSVQDRDFPARRDISARAVFHPLDAAIAPPGGRLTPGGRHSWGAPAPHCRVEFDCSSLGLKWSGTGYHDGNSGVEPLHVGFREWGWGRARLGDETRIYYDAVEADGSPSRHLLAGRNGVLREHAPVGPEETRALSAWLLRLPKWTSVGDNTRAVRESFWEHSPFYARWIGRFEGNGRLSRGICEYIDLTRFARPGVRFMLRYRIYRRRADGEVYPPQVRSEAVFPDDVH